MIIQAYKKKVTEKTITRKLSCTECHSEVYEEPC